MQIGLERWIEVTHLCDAISVAFAFRECQESNTIVTLAAVEAGVMNFLEHRGGHMHILSLDIIDSQGIILQKLVLTCNLFRWEGNTAWHGKAKIHRFLLFIEVTLLELSRGDEFVETLHFLLLIIL